ncbi:hypothetical protein BLNAU_4046 [Blattamonas nauphoetae]|uniref:Uncharacterized protein n=1 Tax=Blattamonas nauphoetae TaxID=2049346 RepID=A0ABQ9YB65_9EUKA|nr:hypothetical protein BLNAU_4046 [Blattamonas nauphoetae]
MMEKNVRNSVRDGELKVVDDSEKGTLNSLLLCQKTKITAGSGRRVGQYNGFSLIKAILMPQLILTLNPQSLSFDKAVDTHTGLVQIITDCFWHSTPSGLALHGIEGRDDQRTVREPIFDRRWEGLNLKKGIRADPNGYTQIQKDR